MTTATRCLPTGYKTFSIAGWPYLGPGQLPVIVSRQELVVLGVLVSDVGNDRQAEPVGSNCLEAEDRPRSRNLLTGIKGDLLSVLFGQPGTVQRLPE